MPLRVSFVPPDFEMTTTSVCSSRCCRLVEHAIDAVRIGVVEKVQAQPVVVGAERIADKLRPERRAADADDAARR